MFDVTSTTAPTVSRGDSVALTRELVRIDSRNPSLTAGGPGEAAVAAVLAAVLSDWGFRVELHEVVPGRPNVVARIGAPGARTLMFTGHLDVVGVESMTHDPWGATEHDGRLYGRGACDMKGGIAAMCAAAVHAARRVATGEIIVAAVIDEEYTSLGTQALVARGLRADAAVITEPTGLIVKPAHKGFVWIDVTVHGRAAHGSQWSIGIDAIGHAGLLLAELDRFDDEVLALRSHPLLGRPSLHASLITGGTEMSTYPDRCVLRLERRTIPGEGADEARAEVEAACTRVKARKPAFSADIQVTLARQPNDVPADAPVVRALCGALEDEGMHVALEGMGGWTDAALLTEAGIPSVLFGPGDIAQAHAAEEFVAVDEVERATRVLARFAERWFSEH